MRGDEVTEVEIAEKIRQAAVLMANAIKNGYDVTVRTSKDGVSVYKDKRTKIL